MQKKEDYRYLGYLASTHFTIHVFTMLLPVLLLPFRDELGISLVQLSLLSSIPRLINVIIYIPTGIISDRYPSRVLTLSFVLTVLGAFTIPLSNNFTMLLLGFTLLTIGSTFYHPPSLRMASEYSKEKISLAMGIHNMGSSLGFAAGPLLLGLMLNSQGWRPTFYLWGFLTIIMVVVSWLYTKNLKGSGASLKEFKLKSGFETILTKDYLMVVAMSTLVESVFNIIVTFLPIYFTDELGMSYSLTSIVSGVAPLAGIIGSFTGGWAGDRFGRYKMGILVLISSTILMIVFPTIRGLYIVLGVYAVYRLLQAAYMPLMNTMIAGHSSPINISLCFSFNFVAVNLFSSLTTTGASILIESQKTPVIFPLAVIGFIPCIILIYALRRTKKAQEFS
ncbi:MFS transporter [Candidatus Bathyarchaeota archaeon]|nr:MFS transporter [Candidatus Bathyarchaeota archaeon]